VAGQDGGNTAPVRDDGYGFVECMSDGDGNCYWGRLASCQQSIDNAASLTKGLLKCNRAQMYAGSGWCYRGAMALGLIREWHCALAATCPI
jgi:hypothetical protein